jgi:hypothetical protein
MDLAMNCYTPVTELEKMPLHELKEYHDMLAERMKKQ